MLKAALQALLPNFLGLLSADYERWVAGEMDRKDTAAGELMRRRPAAGQGPQLPHVPADWVRHCEQGSADVHCDRTHMLGR